jgi:hypothetical protein
VAQQTASASLPSILPGLVSASKTIDGTTKRPLIVHGTPAARDVIAEWNDKPPVAAAIKDQ